MIQLALVAALGIGGRAAAAPVGTGFTYQGKLENTGGPVSGLCNFQFKLFDDGNNQVGGPGNTQTVNNVSVANGLFSVTIDFGPGAFDGSGRWLEIAVQGPGDAGFTTLSPRQPITAAPYAVHALNVASGLTLPFTGAATNQGSTSSGIDALAGVGAFNATNNAATGLSHGIMGKTYSTWQNATGVLGVGLATSGYTSGVQGYATASPNGTGVVGQGQARGGWFEALGGSGIGVEARGTTSPGGIGLLGVGYAEGVRGQNTATTGGYGVRGVGSGAGVFGESSSGFGVEGRYFAFFPPSGTSSGVWGTTNSTNAGSAGVRGEAGAGVGVEGISDTGIGVRGASTSGDGVVGTSTSATGVKGESSTGWGVFGRTSGANSNGVFGQALSTGSSGVLGRNESADGQAVFGYASSSAIGVLGYSVGNDGVQARTDAAGKSGIWAHTYNPSAYAGVFTNFGGGVALLAQGRAQVSVLEILGADLMEKFESAGKPLEPGTVAVIEADGSGRVRASTEPYDPRVAGVVSGAGGIPHGIYLGQGSGLDGDTPLALTGRVYVKCSAENGPIRPGDRLTSSSLPGHAMRATDADRSQGAVIGKALGSLDEGTGLVLVLVNPQ